MRLQSPLERRLPRAAHLALASLLAFALAGIRPAAAEEVIYGPDGAPTVVQHKLYPMSKKIEVALRLQTAINTPLVVHDGLMIDVTYHPNEWFDIGGELFGNYTALSNLSDVIRQKLPQRNATTPKDEIANADQLRFGGLAVARIAPVYGKLNLASELNVHFQTYLFLGAGGTNLHHESVNLCSVGGTAPCPQGSFQTIDSFTFVGAVGGGFRFYFSENWSLSTEVHAYLFPAKYKATNDLTQPTSGTQASYLGDLITFSLGFARLF